MPEIADIDHLLFSHFHMDHVSGFDAFFRVNFGRVGRENHLWGPPGSIGILGHRFGGSWWNLKADLSATWHVHEVDGDTVSSARFGAQEGFAVAHDAGTRRLDGGSLIGTPEVQVRALRCHTTGSAWATCCANPCGTPSTRRRWTDSA